MRTKRESRVNFTRTRSLGFALSSLPCRVAIHFGERCSTTPPPLSPFPFEINFAVRIGKHNSLCFSHGARYGIIYRDDLSVRRKNASCAENYANNIAGYVCIYINDARNNIVMVCVPNISRLTASRSITGLRTRKSRISDNELLRS